MEMFFIARFKSRLCFNLVLSNPLQHSPSLLLTRNSTSSAQYWEQCMEREIGKCLRCWHHIHAAVTGIRITSTVLLSKQGPRAKPSQEEGFSEPPSAKPSLNKATLTSGDRKHPTSIPEHLQAWDSPASDSYPALLINK